MPISVVCQPLKLVSISQYRPVRNPIAMTSSAGRVYATRFVTQRSSFTPSAHVGELIQITWRSGTRLFLQLGRDQPAKADPDHD